MNERVRSAQILIHDGKEIMQRPFFLRLIHEIEKWRMDRLDHLSKDSMDELLRHQGEVKAIDYILRLPEELLKRLENSLLESGIEER